jgi:phage terminase small subunit
MTKTKLDPKRARFVQEYLIDLNATQAAIRAGYSKKTAYSQGQRLLKNVEVQKTIQRAQAARAERVEESKDDWLRELKLIGHSNISDLVDIDSDTGAIRAKGFKEMPKGASRAIESITEVRTIHESADGKQCVVNSRLTFKLHSKLDALDKIGKHLGFFEQDNLQKTPTLYRIEYGDEDSPMPKGGEGTQ